MDVYTDGACSGNPGIGGWGFVLIEEGRPIQKGYGSDTINKTTNQRMELTAAIKGLEATDSKNIIIHSDSSYLCNCFLYEWWKTWEANGWRNSKGVPVANKDLWERLLVLIKDRDVNFAWVKGHAENRWNNECDRLARLAIEENQIQ